MKKVLKPEEKTMEKIVALCKNRGYVYPGSEIYGGLSNSWDYGPLGCLFKDNVKNAWKRKFVQESRYNVALDSAILMNPEVWVATGHVGGFSDPLMDCKDCKTRHRADKLIEDFTGESADGWTNEQMQQFIADNNIACPECGGHNFTDIRQFNLMFKTFQGVTEDAKSQLYLRPETAQGIFVNFPSIQRTTRKKVPFGVCQVGKSFRNEITPGNFIFRIREFEQMECEFFCKPGTDLDWFYYWKDFRHQEHSGKDLSYFDPETNTRYVPYVVEPSLGADRVALAFLCDAYDEENLGTEEKPDVRVVLRLHPALAPFKAAILPLSKKLSEKAGEVYDALAKKFSVDFDDTGSIGKRYRRQDEIGTPFCITYDFDSENDGCVTVRDRDSMEQERVKIDELEAYIAEKIDF